LVEAVQILIFILLHQLLVVMVVHITLVLLLVALAEEEEAAEEVRLELLTKDLLVVMEATVDSTKQAEEAVLVV
jgi:hypothetical protein